MKAIPLFIVLYITSPIVAQEPSPSESTSATQLGVSTHNGKASDAPQTDVEKNKGSLEFLKRSQFVLAKIRNNKRQMDPFGMPMDPTNAVENSAISNQYEEEEATSLSSTSLKNALSDLSISGVYPSKNKIVIGARTFRKGQVFGMKLEELTIRLRFEGIKGAEIYFKDMDTQETASVSLNARPKEFEPIVKGSPRKAPKGMQAMNDLFIVN